VKICGITNLEDAIAAVDLGADALGFNFYEKSPRCIEPYEAAHIIGKLPTDIEKVGVFVNMEVDRIDEYIESLGPTGVQLHGDETPEFVVELRKNTSVKIIKAIRTGPGFEPVQAKDYAADAILLDGYSKDEYGGTGTTIDWEFARDTKEFTPELYIAGGLTADNVRKAVEIVRPQWVDVASGVESSPGRKDRSKVAAFIRAAKEA
jgi:phosphoribosylanthranilate isomerase